MFVISLATGSASAQDSFQDSDVVFEFEVLEQEPESLSSTDVSSDRSVKIYAVSVEPDTGYVTQQEHVYTTRGDVPVQYSTWEDSVASVDFQFDYLIYEVVDDGEVVYESGANAYELPVDKTLEYQVESTSDDSDIVVGSSSDDGGLNFTVLGLIAIPWLLLIAGLVVVLQRGDIR
jgi:hypothetical protein